MNNQKFQELNEVLVSISRLQEKEKELRQDCLNELITNKETNAEFPFARFSIMNRKKVTYSPVVQALVKETADKMEKINQPVVELQTKLKPQLEALEIEVNKAKGIEELNGSAKIELLPSLVYKANKE